MVKIIVINVTIKWGSFCHDLLTRLNLSTISSRQTRLSTIFRLSAAVLASAADEADDDEDADGETDSE